MALDINTIPVNYIFSSRDSIRKKILDRIQDYEQLTGVDLSKTHFFSYIVDILSILSADNSNSLTMSRKENYLVTAQMPSSIYNWASYLSYKPDLARTSYVDLLFSFPLDFGENTNFIIPAYHKFYANDIVFINESDLYCEYKQNPQSFEMNIVNSTSITSLPTYIENGIAYVTVTLKQVEIIEFEQIIGSLVAYQPYTFNQNFRDFISNVKIFIREDEQAEEDEWELSNNYFTMGLGDKKFTYNFVDSSTVKILFGNGVFGRQPPIGGIIRGEIYVTKASAGNVIPGSITSLDPVYYTSSVGGITKEVRINVINVENSVGGSELETIEDTKRKAIARFSSRERLVTENDYNSMPDIIDEGFPFSITQSVLKRSDLKMNEIVIFIILTKEILSYVPTVVSNIGDTASRNVTIPIPTNSIKQTVADSTTEILPYTSFTDDSDDPYIYNYVCPFGIIIESETFAYYYYMANNVQLIPSVTIFDNTTYPLIFPEVNIQSINSYNDMKFTLSYLNPSSAVDMDDVDIYVSLKFNKSLIGPHLCDISIEDGEITAEIATNIIISEEAEILFELYDVSGTTSKIGEVEVTYFIKRNLKSLMFSNCKKEESNIIIYDIPCIEETYFNELTEEEQSNFEKNIIQKMVSELFMGNYRMLTVANNIKFAKTHGRIHTYDLNPLTLDNVIDIQNDAPTPTTPTQGYQEISSAPNSFIGETVPALSTGDYTVNINVNETEIVEYTFSVTDSDDWDTIISSLDDELDTCTASIVSEKIRITTNTSGNESSISITDGTTSNPFLAAIDDLTDYTSSVEEAVAGTGANLGDRYIVGPRPSNGNLWENHENSITEWVDGTTGWFFKRANPGDIVFVEELNKRYIFSGNANRWIEPLFETPYNIQVYVHVSGSPSNDSAIISTIKQQLMYVMANSFGIQNDQLRSIMYKAVQDLRELGVSYCEIKIPEVNISFNYNIENFTSDQLIEYVPVYTYTTEDNIEVKIVR